MDAEQTPLVLWRMHYQFQTPSEVPETTPSASNDKIVMFPATLSADLVFDDSLLERVESVWHKVSESNNGDQFLVFDEREGQDEDDEEEYS
jgi:hypothetical protein